MLIRIATRKSALALWQAEHVAGKLQQLETVSGVELIPMSTRGDEVLDRSLQKIGGKGLFIKELEVAMQEGVADIAVHSMKDVPADMPEGFCVAAVLQRANPGDALLTRDGGGFMDLKNHACVGSSSLRRQAQLKAMRPDIEVQPLRGNVNTRLGKLDSGEYDAIVLACAGLERLGFEQRISEQFSVEQMLPAAAQGVVGIECLEARDDLRKVLVMVQHQETLVTTTAERAVARELEASCQSPVASYATLHDGKLVLCALVASADGSTVIRDELQGTAPEAEALGIRLANNLLQQGAGELLRESAA